MIMIIFTRASVSVCVYENIFTFFVYKCISALEYENWYINAPFGARV